MQRRLAAILAADVVGYSRLIALDELGTLKALKERWASRVSPSVAEHKGRVVKVMGDGVLIEFASTSEAVHCARLIQQRMAEANRDLDPSRAIVLRIGVHLDEIVVDGGDIFGDGVILAVRLQQAADPGDILVSPAVYEQVRQRVPFALRPSRPIRLKNTNVEIVPYSASGDTPAEPASPAPAPAGDTAERSILVIPFAHLGSRDDAYLTDGITEDVIIDLSQVGSLSVMSRNVSFGFKADTADVVEVARRTGVSHVLEGSVRIAGRQVRINVQLVDGKSGVQLWAERFDRALDDIFAMQAEVASRVATSLRNRLGSTESEILARKGTKDVEAYQFYAKARSIYFMAWGNVERLNAARELFVKAATIDPGYARAYAGLADCDAYLWVLGGVDRSAEELVASSSRALELAPNLAEAHASRGLALQMTGDHEAAFAAFERASALDAGLFEPRFFHAVSLRKTGRYAEAAERFEQAERLSPSDPMSVAMLSDVYMALGRRDDSLAAARRSLARIEAALADRQDGHLLALGAAMLVFLDRFDEARIWAAKAQDLAPDNYVVRYNCACAYAVVGELDRAMACLAHIVERIPQARPWLAGFIRHDTQLANLRTLPAFEALIERLDEGRHRS